MSTVSAFLDKLRSEPALQQGLWGISHLPEEERVGAFYALSREFGVPVSEADLVRALWPELSDGDLDGVSGGTVSEVAPAGDDEVSKAVAALFAAQGESYGSLSAQAAAFHEQFVRSLQSGGGGYK